MKTQRKILYALAFCLAFACTREKENPETPLELKTREVHKRLELHHVGIDKLLQEELAHATDSTQRWKTGMKIKLHTMIWARSKKSALEEAKLILAREKARGKTSEEQ